MGLRLPDKWIWDSWFATDGDTFHAFYLHASRALGDPERRHQYPMVGHAVSTDLVSWTVVADALMVSDSPAFDDGTTWTGSVIRDADGLWWMFYTGSTNAEGRLVQRVLAATSPDLMTWTKCAGDFMVEADERWYERLDLSAWNDEAWRDPFVMPHPSGHGWAMLITARAKDGDPRERGVVGFATSPDLLTWTVEPPRSASGQGFGQLEVFQYAVVDGVPLIVFSCAKGELGAARQATDAGGIYSVVVDPSLEHVDIASARLFHAPNLYCGRLVQGPDGVWNLFGFVIERDGQFAGELSDPIRVSADSERGLFALEA